MTEFKFSFDNKRYHTLAYHNRTNFVKTYKAVINTGLSCPNVDGTKAFGGCIFCSGKGKYFTHDDNLSITEQLRLEYVRICKKLKDKSQASITAYFQSGTNTYTTAIHLYNMLDEAFSFPHVKSIAIATRADCLSDEILEVLEIFSKKIPLTVEIGLQSSNDNTARLINRAYDFCEFESAVRNLKNRGIRVLAHIINGLPNETKADMLKTISDVASLGIDAVKIHLLHVNRETALAKMFEKGEYTPLGFDEYIDIVISQLELLPENVVVERITGDADKAELLVPLWSKDKLRVLGTIDKEMAKRKTMQGIACKTE